MDPILEQQLLEGCRKGDRAAQKRLFDELAGRMLSVCLRYVGDREVARDLVQEGFVTLFDKLDSYSGKGSFEGWARKIFVNNALMYLRKNDALKETNDIDDARGLYSADPTPADNLGYQDIMALIAVMPPGFRTVFNMAAIEGYSHKEIAKELGISENTSRSQYKRAREWLQERIKYR